MGSGKWTARVREGRLEKGPQQTACAGGWESSSVFTRSLVNRGREAEKAGQSRGVGGWARMKISVLGMSCGQPDQEGSGTRQGYRSGLP